MGLLSSSTKKVDVRTPEAKSADKWLQSILKQGTPDIPTEQIAGMSDAEKMAQKLVTEYGGGQAEGLDTLRAISQGSTDITQDPTIQALMATITKSGSEEANRLNRSLMLRGSRGSAAQDELGRSVTQTQQSLMSTLAPYAEAAKNRQMSAAQLLNQLGESSTLNRLNALSTTGSLPRTLQQLQNTANYQKLMTEVLFPYQQGTQVASTIKQGGQTALSQSPSVLSQVSGLAGAVASFL